MIQTVRRPAGTGKATAYAIRERQCPACRAERVRVVRKVIRHAAREAAAVLVCDACKHFWDEHTKH